MNVISRDLQRDAIDAAASHDIQRGSIGSAEVQIPDFFRNVEGCEVLTFRRKDPNAGRARAVHVALDIDLHAPSGAPIRFIRGGVEEDLSVRQRAVGEGHDSASRSSGVPVLLTSEILFIRREGNAVRAGQVLDQELQLVVGRRSAGFLIQGFGNAVHAVDLEFPLMLVLVGESVRRIG